MPSICRSLAVMLLAGVAACGYRNEQTSAGTYVHELRSDYYVPRTGSSLGGTAASASATGLLRFPARIGLARIVNRMIAPIPAKEADVWIAFAQAHRDLGTFVPMNPLIAAFSDDAYNPSNRPPIGDFVRLAAAQQHMDAVLIYTTGVEGTDHATPLSILDATIIGGYIVPSRRLNAQATATARLIDVRNGFLYGDLMAIANDSSLVPDFGSGDRKGSIAQAAEAMAVEGLAVKVGALTSYLRPGFGGNTPAAANIGNAP